MEKNRNYVTEIYSLVASIQVREKTLNYVIPYSFNIARSYRQAKLDYPFTRVGLALHIIVEKTHSGKKGNFLGQLREIASRLL